MEKNCWLSCWSWARRTPTLGGGLGALDLPKKITGPQNHTKCEIVLILHTRKGGVEGVPRPAAPPRPSVEPLGQRGCRQPGPGGLRFRRQKVPYDHLEKDLDFRTHMKIETHSSCTSSTQLLEWVDFLWFDVVGSEANHLAVCHI